jgi:hypothetical protein
MLKVDFLMKSSTCGNSRGFFPTIEEDDDALTLPLPGVGLGGEGGGCRTVSQNVFILCV